MLPAAVAARLGLNPSRGRLDFIRITLNGRSCPVEPFHTDGPEVVIGHVPLTALGLIFDPDGRLTDDPLPLP